MRLVLRRDIIGYGKKCVIDIFPDFSIQSISYKINMNQISQSENFSFACKQTIRMATPLVGSRVTNATNRFVGMLLIAPILLLHYRLRFF